LVVRTSRDASPSGFPFQVVQQPGTLAEPAVYARRRRVCSFGYLAEAYADEDCRLGFRCPAEPVGAYARKGGDPRQTAGRVCLCSGLAAAAGFARTATGGPEPMILTLGKDTRLIEELVGRRHGTYAAEDVVRAILAPSI
jgi:hypothetical protein